MTKHPDLQRLADHDPARDLNPTPTNELADQAKSRPVAAIRVDDRRPVRRRVAVVAVGALAASAVLVLLPTNGPTPTVDLASAAYAKTTTPAGRIGYSLVVIDATTRKNGRIVGRERIREEAWNRGRQAHWVQTITRQNADELITDHVVDSRGVLRTTNQNGLLRIVRASDNADSAEVIAREQEGFVADFRRAFEGGTLDPDGDVTFAGRPARRYIVNSRRLQGPGQPPLAFYIDRETQQPLGRTSSLNFSVGNSNAVQTTSYVLTVRKLAQLPPSKANVENLTTSTVPRRRDSRGCIRSAVRNARTADTARPYDCTGKPGAPLPTP